MLRDPRVAIVQRVIGTLQRITRPPRSPERFDCAKLRIPCMPESGIAEGGARGKWWGTGQRRIASCPSTLRRVHHRKVRNQLAAHARNFDIPRVSDASYARYYETQYARGSQLNSASCSPIDTARANTWRELRVTEIHQRLTKISRLRSPDHQSGGDDDGCYIVIT